MIYQTFLLSIGLITIYMTGMFFLSLIKKDNSVVDTAYGIGFILITLMTDFVSRTHYLVASLVSIFTIIWAVRLSGRIYLRNKGKPEDFRYKAWRDKWTYFKTRSFFQIYVLQGFIILLIASPVIFLNSFSFVEMSSVSHLIIVLGILLWVKGFIFESVGDHQLDQFIESNSIKKQNNEDAPEHIMKKGLWSLTRHPNYFGEVAMWWGVWIMSMSIYATQPLVLFTIISPLTITFLLLKVSGIPMLEAKYEDDQEFQEYKKTTSAFIPWFKK